MKKNIDKYDDLLDLFANTNDRESMSLLFEDMFTEGERKDLELRWKLMNDLYNHVPQREIASDLHISLCRITRGSKMLKKENGFVKKYLSEHYDDHLHR